MSRIPRSADSKNEPMDMQAILDQLDRLTVPEAEAEPTSKESLPARWKKDDIVRILNRIKATTSDMDQFLKNPQTVRMLDPQASQEQRLRDYVATKERVETLKVAIKMANDDVQRLSDAYLPGVDSDGLKTIIASLKEQVQTLEDICNRF